MEMSGPPLGTIRFGLYELDVEAGELRKNGVKLKLQDQPFQVLLTLLENPGQVVTREALRERVWPSHTFVDFDQGLNTAIAKIREALGDSASNPRFVETVPRRGYRFIAPVEMPEAEDPPEAPGVEPARRRSVAIPFLAVGVLAGLAAGLVLGLFSGSREGNQAPLRKFSFTPDEYVWTAQISPDGKRIAYTAGAPSSLWILDLDQFEPRKVDGTEGAGHPFWSPDSSSVGFAALGELRVAPAVEGSLRTLCEIPGLRAEPPGLWRASWSPDGSSIVFDVPDGVYEVAANGGRPTRIIDLQRWGEYIAGPHFLPARFGDRMLLYQRGGEGHVVQNLADGRFRQAPLRGYAPFFSPTGHVITHSGRTLWATPYGGEAGRPDEAFPIARHARDPSVSRDCTLVYIHVRGVEQRLVWVDRDGGRLGEIVASYSSLLSPSLSPDGRSIAFAGTVTGTRHDIWIHEFERSDSTRLTFGPYGRARPTWSPDGARIAFSRGGRKWRAYDVQRDGSGKEEPVLPDGSHISDWSRDGRFIVYQSGTDIWFLEVGKADAEPIAFLETPFPERAPKFSPDGRYVAFCSGKSGRDEVYVQPFPGGGRESKVSQNGGTQPRWRSDGGEIYYVEHDTLVATPVTVSPEFALGNPKRLFAHPGLVSIFPEQTYDVGSDGERFVVIESEDTAEGGRPAIHMVQNWHQEIFER